MKFQVKNYFFDDYIKALQYLTAHRYLVKIYSIQMLVMILLMTIPIFLLPFVKEVFNASTKQFAYFEALLSLGVFAGRFIAPILCRTLGPKSTLMGLSFLISTGLVILSTTEHLESAYLAYGMGRFGLSSWAVSVSQA
jgi:Na+/melibiose symporter-like transporter